MTDMTDEEVAQAMGHALGIMADAERGDIFEDERTERLARLAIHLSEKLEKLKPGKMAPVQGYSAGIPWAMHLRAYDAYCKQYGKQPALIEGWCRGGFHTGELDMFIPGWRDELSEMAELKAAREQAEAREKVLGTDYAAMFEERVKWQGRAQSLEQQLGDEQALVQITEAKVELAEARLAKAREDLRKYGRHRIGCQYRIYSNPRVGAQLGEHPCDCGLDAALKGEPT